jgi:capsular polysaccharide biosynthesis protein
MNIQLQYGTAVAAIPAAALAVLTFTYLMDDTVKTAEDVEREFGVMPLTVIPEGKIEGLSGSESEQSRSRRGRKGKK